MMSAEAIAARYAAALFDRVTVARLSGVGSSQIALEYPGIRARLASYSPAEIGGLILQGDQKGILLAADLNDAGFPIPLIKGDRVTCSDGRIVTVQAIDPNTRAVGGVVIAYEVQLRGQ
jgi:hypothetical protein